MRPGGTIVVVKHIDIPALLITMGVAMILFGSGRLHEIIAQLIEALNNFRGGGPGSPSHPIPACDTRLLNRRRSRPQHS